MTAVTPVVLGGSSNVLPITELCARSFLASVDLNITCTTNTETSSQQLRIERFGGLPDSGRVRKEVRPCKHQRDFDKYGGLHDAAQYSRSNGMCGLIFQCGRSIGKNQQRFRETRSIVSNHEVAACMYNGRRQLHSCSPQLAKMRAARPSLPPRTVLTPVRNGGHRDPENSTVVSDRPKRFTVPKEEMLSSVRDNDRRRLIEENERGWHQSRFEHDMLQCSAPLEDLPEKGQISEYIRRVLEEARIEGRLAYRLRHHPRAVYKLSLIRNEIMDVTRGARIIVEARREREFNLLEKRLDKLESDLEKIDIETRGIKTKSISGSLAIHKKATRILDEITEMKFVELPDPHSLWAKIEDTNAAIIQLLERTGLGTHGSACDALSRATDTILEIIYPRYGNAGQRQLYIGLIAHQVREIEFNVRIAKVLPIVTFSKRWSSATIARYVWPLRYDSDELTSIFRKTAFDRHRNPDTGKFLRKSLFRSLSHQIEDYCDKLERICTIFTNIIGQGYNSLCPHPSAKLHRLQTKAFSPIQRFDEAWADMSNAAKFAYGCMRAVCPEGHGSKTRDKVFKLLEDVVKPPARTDHALSRRGNYDVRDRVIVRHSSRLLAEAPASTGYASASEFRKSTLDSIKPFTHRNRSLPKDIVSGATSIKSLNTNSLYPEERSIPIHFVRSHPTLLQATKDLSTHTVVGVDISFKGGHPLNATDIQYVTMATATNVYIFDSLALESIGRISYSYALRSVLESASVLKVGMNTELISRALWHNYSQTLVTSYDVAQDTDKSGVTATALLLARRFGFSADMGNLTNRPLWLRENDPRRFFHCLAMRAYTPLKLFEQDYQHCSVVKSDHGVVVDLNEHYKMLQKLNIADAELGPVVVDKCEMLFDLRSTMVLGQKKVRPTAVSRKVWMQNASLSMARDYLRGASREKPQSFSRISKISLQSAEIAMSSYFLATIFKESLLNIERILNLPKAVEYILWVTNHMGVRLNKQDEIEYRNATGLNSTALEALFNRNRIYIPFTAKNRLHNVRCVEHKSQSAARDIQEELDTSRQDEEDELMVEWAPSTGGVTHSDQRSRRLNVRTFEAEVGTLEYNTPLQDLTQHGSRSPEVLRRSMRDPSKLSQPISILDLAEPKKSNAEIKERSVEPDVSDTAKANAKIDVPEDNQGRTVKPEATDKVAERRLDFKLKSLKLANRKRPSKLSPPKNSMRFKSD